jgi:hypothetical protein
VPQRQGSVVRLEHRKYFSMFMKVHEIGHNILTEYHIIKSEGASALIRPEQSYLSIGGKKVPC